MFASALVSPRVICNQPIVRCSQVDSVPLVRRVTALAAISASAGPRTKASSYNGANTIASSLHTGDTHRAGSLSGKEIRPRRDNHSMQSL